jgi:DNA-binding transcriptional MocR family regulator
LFVWLRLPERLSAKTLLSLASEEGGTFAPGSQVSVDGSGGDGYVRLNFACQRPEIIEEGIRRLGKAMKRGATGLAG